ncbi:MAG: metallophosphoesterase [Promethearchaeota archaeon]
MSGKSIHDKKLYVCRNCKQGFLYTETEAQNKLCRNCLTQTLVLQRRRIIFVCPTCNRHYDSNNIINLDIPKDKRPLFHLGTLICNKDEKPVIIRSLNEDISQLTKNIYGKFVQDKETDISDERVFLEKLQQLRAEDVHEDVDDSLKPDSQMEEIVAPGPDYFNRKSTWWYGEKFQTPHANEFWRHYFIERKIYDPTDYLGNGKRVLKIKELLDEVNLYLLNPDKINPGYPVIDHLDNGKIYYVGDTHGSIYDLDQCIKFFVGEIEKALKNDYPVLIIFMGDYVDRHEMDIHNLLYIFSFALQFPQHVRLLRGNHEEVTINMQYGFWANINKFLPNSYLFNDFEYTFMNLPLSHVAHTSKGTVMALHGGIPFYPENYEKIPKIPRIVDGSVVLKPSYSTVDEMDVLSRQILWGDPESRMPPNMYYLPSRRGVGYSFGKEIFEEFLKVNEVQRVIRSHEVFLEGNKEYFDNRLFSIFSSSNYGSREIAAKILEIDLSKEWESNWRHYTILDELES